ncbi:aspartate/methionine/tyrosine aminotransferase [Actinoplanes tereljensis]|uniref:Aminotransferase class I/classII large domain-containing protein n=1 Tax=Paractinoplanes tereljensis TaxID=571912 RepID=A0A919NF79_9ACTN|nr:aminotransferase class I/II-fold pyridoxal phosphate-dependent enzyme [Actinoplanes tereljensis]GIF17348.1 hypothetical protein Ate02nite_00780 [Actinoplanes tereljensis]
MNRHPNLTRYERDGLALEFNLTDGHARQGQDAAQDEIRCRLPELYLISDQSRQLEAEREFQAAFFELAGQGTAATDPHTLLCTSASLATDLVATFLHRRRLSVSLMQPCFDNLATIMARRRVRMTPLDEEVFAPPRSGAAGTDAVFLVLPNNPTGFVLDRDGFTRLARRCAAEGQILILDWTFRFFSDLDGWDQYAVLRDTGVSYVCIEDTGKTWPTLDLKCSILASSPDLYPEILEVHNDVLLNVSPFVLRLVREYILDSLRRGLDVSVRRPVAVNRALLRETLAGTVLTPVPAPAAVSVEWVRIDDPELDSADVVELLAEQGIGILPGDHFFWAESARGRRHVRFALARDPRMFAALCDRIAAASTLRPVPRRPLVA